MFDRVFDNINRKVPEVRMVGVWGTDGLELQKKVFAPLDVDLDFLGAEVAEFITKINAIQPTPESVKVKLVVDSGWLYVFRLTPDFFLIMLADPTVLNGKVSFYADLYRSQLEEVL